MNALSAGRLVSRIPVLWRAVIAALILCGAIGLLVESRARILRSGSEVRLRTVPIDPRDLFRGDYVVLNYEISTPDLATVQGDRNFAKGETAYVRLAPGPDGFARVAGIYKAAPTPNQGEVVMAGRVQTVRTCPRNADGSADCDRGRDAVRIDYGLESYFVPQGQGLAIERTERARLEVVAAVSSSGEAAIKRLLIDGKLVHAEPPY